MKNTIKVFVLVALTLAAMDCRSKDFRRGTEKSKYRIE